MEFTNSISIITIVFIMHSIINVEATITTSSPSSTKLVSKLNKVAAVTPSPAADDPSIRSLCLATKNTKKCLELILPFPTGATDPISILNVEIQALYDITGQAISTAMRLSKEHRAGVPSLEDTEILKVCIKHYQVAAKEIVKAAYALSARDSKTVNSMLRATVSSFTRCDHKAFGKRGRWHKGVIVKEIDQVLLDMAKLCLEISTLIQKGTP